MNILIKNFGRIVIIKPGSELNISLIEKIYKKILEIKSKKNCFFIFDLEKNNWIDSMGLRCILAAADLGKEIEKKVVIINYSSKVKQIIETLNLQNWIVFEKSEREAIGFFNNLSLSAFL